MLPCASAGSITSAICCAREANISAISASGESPEVDESAALPNLFPSHRPARFASFDHGMSGLAQDRRQLAHMRALAGSVEPFEGDELPAS